MRPEIIWAALPPSERENGFLARDKLGALDRHLERFTADIELCIFCSREIGEARQRKDLERRADNYNNYMETHTRFVEERKIFLIWQEVAGRDAAITLWDFGTALYQLKNAVARCATLKAIIDWKKLHDAAGRFSEYFPAAKKIRDAGAHIEDISNTFDKNAASSIDPSHGITLKNNSRVVVQGFSGSEYTVTIDEAVLTVDLSSKTTGKMLSILGEVFDALRPAESTTREMADRQFRPKQT